MQAHLRQFRISPKKANLVAALVRGKAYTEAVDMLNFTPKKAARPLMKLIQSAAANAEANFQQNKDALYVKEIIVTEGPTYKRGVPISRGRQHPILKRTSHITVKMGIDEAKAESKKSKTATPAKKAEAVEEKPENTKAAEAETKKEAPKKEAPKKTTKKEEAKK